MISQTPETATPVFELVRQSRFPIVRFRPSIPASVVLLCFVIAAGAFLVPKHPRGPTAPAELGMLMNASREWDVAWSADPEGLRKNRQLRVLRPTLTRANSKLQFLWHPAQPVGCVAHYSDPGNYSGLRLHLVRQRSSQAIAVERFLVWNGKYQSSGGKLVPVQIADAGALPVSLEIAGAAIRIKIREQTIDYWIVPRFRAGSLGFFADGEGRAQVEEVRITPLGEPGRS